MKAAPIILFVYNRPDHTRLTVEALLCNRGAQDSELFIFSDGPKNTRHAEDVAKVRTYLRTIDGFRSVNIIERDENLGLAASVIAGVTATLKQYPSCIVLEDDMLSTPNFLEFMNAALITYQHRRDVFSVTGYNYPLPIPAEYSEDVYLSYRGSSWGWGTWADRWEKVDWAVSDYAQFAYDSEQQALFARAGDDLPGMLKMQMEGRLDSWAIRFDYAHHKHNAFCVHAIRSKIQNIGFDGSGVHCGVSDNYKVVLDPADRGFTLPRDLALNPEIIKIFDARFRPQGEAQKTFADDGKALGKISATISRIKKPARTLMRYVGLGS